MRIAILVEGNRDAISTDGNLLPRLLGKLIATRFWPLPDLECLASPFVASPFVECLASLANPFSGRSAPGDCPRRQPRASYLAVGVVANGREW